MDEFDVYNAHAPYQDQMWDEALKRIERGEKVSFVPATAENIPGRKRSWETQDDSGYDFGGSFKANQPVAPLLFSGAAGANRSMMQAENSYGQLGSPQDLGYGGLNLAGGADDSSSSAPVSYGGIKRMSDWDVLQQEKARFQDRPPQAQNAWMQQAQMENKQQLMNENNESQDSAGIAQGALMKSKSYKASGYWGRIEQNRQPSSADGEIKMDEEGRLVHLTPNVKYTEENKEFIRNMSKLNAGAVAGGAAILSDYLRSTAVQNPDPFTGSGLALGSMLAYGASIGLGTLAGDALGNTIINTQDKRDYNIEVLRDPNWLVRGMQ